MATTRIGAEPPVLVLDGAVEEPLRDLDSYRAVGGYAQLERARAISPHQVTDELIQSNLRGRGGAFFPTGRKASFIPTPDKVAKPIYITVNADESEPGTFKDREIMLKVPHRLLEGCLIAAHAIQSKHVFIYIRGEYAEEYRVLERARAEADRAGLLEDVIITIHRGAGAYICGEETGLIESLEGKRAYPRIKPPYFPAVLGLYMCPTIVNNVETLCHVKHIIAMGGAKYAQLGRPNNSGTRIVCVSGDVQQPGYFEIEVGSVTMGQLIHDMAGGLKWGRRLKAIIPGGSSAKVLRADETFRLKERQTDGSMVEREMTIDQIPMDFDSLTAAGSMAGSGGVIVLDDSRDMVWTLNNINEFYAHESCGQCTPCREGSLWMQKITDRMLLGGGVVQDPDTLKTVADNIAGRTICAFGEACAWPTQSFVDKFRDEFSARAEKPEPPPLPPEYTSDELIKEDTIPTLSLARDPGWERAGTAGTI
jgi:NADH-quinone oxidoreductase subunit F